MIIQRENTALVVGDQKIGYNELLCRITQFKNAYALEARSRAVVFSENRQGWVYAFYSIWASQGVPVPIDFMSAAGEVAYILNDCKPTHVWVSKERLPVLTDALALIAHRPEIQMIDDVEATPLRTEEGASFPHRDDDTAVIIYTSGTTGSPKGVMLSYANLALNIRAISEDIPIYHQGQRVLMLLPLHHIFPLLGTMIMPLHCGSLVAISPSMVSADIINTLQNNRITILIGVPRLFAAIYKGISDKINQSAVAKMLFKLAKSIDSQVFSRFIFKSVHQKFGGAVEFMISGGAALEPEVGNGFKTLGFEILEGYGMTEAAPMITFTRPGKVKIGSPGFPMAGVEVDFKEGEIIARGANIMQGYYNKPEETAQILKDGWLYTGDLGHFDSEGFLIITGRKKEIIVLSNGKNINPAEIEEKLSFFSTYIKEVGVYQDKDQLKAIVLPQPAAVDAHGTELGKQIKREVIEPYNRSVAPYKKITGITLFQGELPRTRLGKLQRFKLAELQQDESAELSAIKEPDTQEYRIVRDFIAKEKNCTVRPYHHIELDLGLDSLDKVGLQVFLQSTFGIEVETDQMVKFESVEALAAWVSGSRTRMEIEKIDWKNILKEKVSLPLPGTWFTGRLFVKMSKLFFQFYFQLKAKGMERIPDGPVIIAPNHQSYFDGLFVASFLKNATIKNTYFYAKEKHIRQPWLKFMANRHHVIVMDLNNLKDSIQKMGEALKLKKNLIIFPEGTRTVNGKLGDFKKTFAILSKELDIPIVPVTIKGAYEALPKGSFFPRPFRKVRVEFLEPVYPRKSSYDDIAENVHHRIEMTLEKQD